MTATTVTQARPAPTPSADGARFRSRLRASDLIRTGTSGIRTRPGRAAFTAVGIAIGIASMVAVLGISASSRADLLAELDRLGTNLLQVQPGQDLFGDSATLPAEAPSMIRRIGPVDGAASVAKLKATVQRNDQMAENTRNGLTVHATEPGLYGTLEGSMRTGRFLDHASSGLPTVVLGSVAAERLGITDLAPGPRVWIAGQWFSVIGVLDPLPLHPDLDRSAFVGLTVARDQFGVKGLPSTIYVRAAPEQVADVRAVLARTANPADPNEVQVARPSDALEARTRVDENLQRLLLGLGGVALLVGGLGIANVMIISVLERRTEIGVRRALGATKSHIAVQFVVESTLLALLGGLAGVAIGYVVTAGYANRQGWLIDLPVEALVVGVAAALAVGALAGLYPAARAARLDPAEAVRPGG